MPELHPRPQLPLSQQVPGWVLRRLENTLNYKGGVRYESSLYGPLLNILISIFVVDRHFMIKPQGLLRLEFDGGVLSDVASVGTTREDSFELEGVKAGPEGLMDGPEEESEDIDAHFLALLECEAESGQITEANLRELEPSVLQVDHPDRAGGVDRGFDIQGLPPLNYSDGDVTTDSNRGYVSSKEKGREKAGNLGYADFIGVKATESPRDDTIITIIEVKKDDEELHESEAQIFRYMQFAAPKQRAPELKCFLVCGLATQVWMLQTPGHNARAVKVEEYATTSPQFTADLHAIAGKFWA